LLIIILNLFKNKTPNGAGEGRHPKEVSNVFNIGLHSLFNTPMYEIII